MGMDSYCKLFTPDSSTTSSSCIGKIHMEIKYFTTYFKREPSCIHSDGKQPASVCIECSKSPFLKEWKDYWLSKDSNGNEG